MQANGVPGLSIAITKDEKLVYARGFGLADQAAGVAVNPRHRFRVASVSKPITSIAVMKMIENGTGKLALGRTVFGAGGVLGTTYGTPPYDARETQITVRHLLEDTSGMDNTPSDVMFEGTGMTHAQLLGSVLDTRTPAAAPGTTYAYLNFGYCVLGRIVDSASQSHNGAFFGTIAFAWIRNDGYTAAVVANTRPAGDGFAFGMRATVDGLIDQVTTWPTWDMF